MKSAKREPKTQDVASVQQKPASEWTFVTLKSEKVHSQQRFSRTSSSDTERPAHLARKTPKSVPSRPDSNLEKALDPAALAQASSRALGDVSSDVATDRRKAFDALRHLTHDSITPSVYLKGLCDPDHRVRASALQSMVPFIASHPTDSPVFWKPCVSLLEDRYPSVRSRALSALTSLRAVLPATLQVIAFGEGERLTGCHDDAFVRVCNLVFDPIPSVRVCAFEMISQFPSVEAELVAQAFDKKLMSYFQLRKSSHEKLRRKHGTLASIEDPSGDLSIEDVAIMSAGACGAFVHGLEDEIAAVRVAAVKAIQTRCSSNEQLCAKALDFLVDMFNDEIDAVRLTSIDAISSMGKGYTLQEDQLDVMLGILDDVSLHIRHAMHRLLSHVSIVNHICLHVVIHALTESLKRYRIDRWSVWRCVSSLGRRHAYHAELLSKRLLNTNDHFQTVEPDVNDVSYVTVAVLLGAALKQNPAFKEMLPPFFERHYAYIQSELLDAVEIISDNAGKNLVSAAAITQRCEQVSMFCSSLKAAASSQRIASHLPHDYVRLRQRINHDVRACRADSGRSRLDALSLFFKFVGSLLIRQSNPQIITILFTKVCCLISTSDDGWWQQLTVMERILSNSSRISGLDLQRQLLAELALPASDVFLKTARLLSLSNLKSISFTPGLPVPIHVGIHDFPGGLAVLKVNLPGQAMHITPVCDETGDTDISVLLPVCFYKRPSRPFTLKIDLGLKPSRHHAFRHSIQDAFEIVASTELVMMVRQ